MVISPRIVSADSTDFSSISALLGSPRFAGKRGEELALAIWEFMVDPKEGFYHFWTPLERLAGRKVTDPLKLLNVFGWGLCGTSANLMAVLFKAAGFDDARIVCLGRHVVPEVFYEGAWHLLDADLRALHRKHPPGQSQIASVADCVADRTLISRQQNPSVPYYPPGRSLEKTAELYDTTPGYHRCFDEQTHTMDFALRPGETLIRSTDNEGKWMWYDNYDELARQYGNEWHAEGPWERNPPHRSFGNGQWVYEPRLTHDFEDFERGVFACEGLATAADGLVATRKGNNWCVFDFDSPYVFTGTPAGKDANDARDGITLDARVFLKSRGCSAKIEMSVAPDLPWFTVWRSSSRGEHDVKLDLTAYAINAYRYLLRFSFEAAEAGACGLGSLRVSSSILLAPASLGRLRDGRNELTVRFGDERGLPTRRRTLEADFLDEADVRAKAYRLDNLRFVGEPDWVVPADATRGYEIVFKLDAPPSGRLQRVYAFGSFRGKRPDDPAEGRVAACVSASPDGPWEPVFTSPVLDDPKRWHFSVQGQQDLPGAGRTAYVKLVGKTGMAEAKIRTTWLDERAERLDTPLEITHIWEEASGCCKGHTEQIASPGKPYTYELVCGQRPTLSFLVVHVHPVPYSPNACKRITK